MCSLEAKQKQIDDLEIKMTQLQEDSWHQIEELESSLHILQQKYKEGAENHLSSLNAAVTAPDKAIKELDVLGKSLQQKVLSFKEQLSQAFKADFVVKSTTFYGARWHDGKAGHDPFMKIPDFDPSFPCSYA